MHVSIILKGLANAKINLSFLSTRKRYYDFILGR